MAYTATVPNTNLLHYFSTAAGEGKYPTVSISGVEYLSYSYYDHYSHSGVSLTGLEYSASLLPDTISGADNRPGWCTTRGFP
ncbi:hypothetical protein KRR40_39150 [Niabella defluvii]|nr:hypothetical protein KRR40_39150 [Niabella sp. I65]